ncbi:MAG: alpha/beta hydrolase [Gemmatimonadaceae bacterium]|jgi:pimeloyl-ACP methyl ester carboxylesterase|nr:alpha/beta hydrolase [Gemmatimonadaceae bacterium]
MPRSILIPRAAGAPDHAAPRRTTRIAALVTLVICGLRPLAAHPAADSSVLRIEPYTFVTRSGDSIVGELGTLQVRRRHDDPASPTLALRFVRLPARAPRAGVAPVLYLAGGPGGSGIETARGARWPVFDAVRAHADLILLDQRGTGRSDGAPPCPPQGRMELPLDSLVTEARALAAMRAEAERCVAWWRAQGVDLDAFTTVQSAHDIDALRRALGLRTISLWGMSYGTHLALTTLRLHGAQVQRAVLMGTEGPDHTIKRPLAADSILARLDARLAADTVARQRIPSVRASLARTFAALDRSPLHVRVAGPAGDSTTVVLGRFDVQLLVAGMLGQSQSAVRLPALALLFESGDPRLLAPFARRVKVDVPRLAAMPLAMDVASGATAARLALVAREAQASLVGDALNFPWPGIGAGLGIRDLGDAFRAPVRTRVPTFFVSGTMDGRTPPSNAEEVMRGFTDATHLILDGAGHDDELWLSHPVIAERLAEFLAGGRVAGGTVPVRQRPFSFGGP